jgi:large subunit ribosomal protein L28
MILNSFGHFPLDIIETNGQKSPTMSRVCKITGKRPLVGNNVSHSNHRTKMRQLPNLRKRRLFDETTGQWISIKVSASGLRTITKNGLKKALAEARG